MRCSTRWDAATGRTRPACSSGPNCPKATRATSFAFSDEVIGQMRRLPHPGRDLRLGGPQLHPYHALLPRGACSDEPRTTSWRSSAVTLCGGRLKPSRRRMKTAPAVHVHGRGGLFSVRIVRGPVIPAVPPALRRPRPSPSGAAPPDRSPGHRSPRRRPYAVPRGPRVCRRCARRDGHPLPRPVPIPS